MAEPRLFGFIIGAHDRGRDWYVQHVTIIDDRVVALPKGLNNNLVILVSPCLKHIVSVSIVLALHQAR